MVENTDSKWHSIFVFGWYISHRVPDFYAFLDIGEPFIIVEYEIAYFKSQLKSYCLWWHECAYYHCIWYPTYINYKFISCTSIMRDDTHMYAWTSMDGKLPHQYETSDYTFII